MRRYGVALALRRRHFGTKCPLGSYSFQKSGRTEDGAIKTQYANVNKERPVADVYLDHPFVNASLR